MAVPFQRQEVVFLSDTTKKAGDGFPGAPVTPGAGADIVFVLDVSGSMGSGYGSVSRLEAAKSALLDAIDVLEANAANRGALVTFSSGAALAQGLTSEWADLRAAVTAAAVDGGTNTWLGIQAAQAHLEATPNPGGNVRGVVVASDGESGSYAQTTGAGDTLKAAHSDYRLFAIAINSGTLNTNELYYLGETIGDGFYDAANPEALSAAMVTVASLGGNVLAAGVHLLTLLNDDMAASGFRVGAASFNSSDDPEDGATEWHAVSPDIAAVAAAFGAVVPTVEQQNAASANVPAGLALTLRMLTEAAALLPAPGGSPAVVVVANTDLDDEGQYHAGAALLELKRLIPQCRVCLLYSSGRGTNRLYSWFTALFDAFHYVGDMGDMEQKARAFLFLRAVPVPTLEARATVSGGLPVIVLTANPAPPVGA